MDKREVEEIYKDIKRKEDGSFVVIKNGYPYHIPDNEEFKEECIILSEYAKSNPLNIGEYVEEVSGVTEEELVFIARNKRDILLEKIEKRINRYHFQKELGIDTVDNEEWYIKALEYMQLLRNIPQQENFPYEIIWPQEP